MNLPFPDQKYRCILADPPWRFETWGLGGRDRSADKHYSGADESAFTTMTLDDICGMPVAEVAADDCCLFLWV